eukprot:TRINITY_DN9719_c1_g1_i1.p1 TRINITY_DN9719_c1_g1~~TRINITY_DN9719_c1_g1_i1.p1  ORF type:complete len:235 (+),score=75.87 TRINITY_DN9719_c1_g1_i1:77-781(+)
MAGKLRCVKSIDDLKGDVRPAAPPPAPANAGPPVHARPRGPPFGAMPYGMCMPHRQLPPTVQRPYQPPPGCVDPRRAAGATDGPQVWGAPPPPPYGVPSGCHSNYHGWELIQDPREACKMHSDLIEFHHNNLAEHFRLMWHHQNMYNQAIAAADGVAPLEMPPPQLPPMPPPLDVRFGERGVKDEDLGSQSSRAAHSGTGSQEQGLTEQADDDSHHTDSKDDDIKDDAASGGSD